MLNLTEDKGFTNIIEFLQLLDLLSRSTESTFLASEGFSPRAPRSENNRIQVAYGYILKNFTNPELKIGEQIRDPLPPIDFGRIAAQTAKQVIVQRVRDAERDRSYE